MSASASSEAVKWKGKKQNAKYRLINTQEEITEAFERYRAGKMGRLEAGRVSA